jgi:hypothetical protein
MRNAIRWLSIACAVNSIVLTPVCKAQDPAPATKDTRQTESIEKSSNAKFYKFRPLGESVETGELFSKLYTAESLKNVKSPKYLEGQTEMPNAVRTKGEDLSYGAENWDPTGYCWQSPAFCHKPLYFEQPNLERYAKYPNCAVATIGSIGHFYSTALLLPAKFALKPCWTPSCTLGNQRPGDCNPKQR